MIILAIAIAIVLGAVAYNSFPEPKYGSLVRLAATVAGALIGFWGTYWVAGNL